MVSEDRKAEGLALSLSIADNLTLSRLRGLGHHPDERVQVEAVEIEGRKGFPASCTTEVSASAMSAHR